MGQYFCEYGGTWHFSSDVSGDVNITVSVEAKDEEQAKERASLIVAQIVKSLPNPFTAEEDDEANGAEA